MLQSVCRLSHNIHIHKRIEGFFGFEKFLKRIGISMASQSRLLGGFSNASACGRGGKDDVLGNGHDAVILLKKYPYPPS